jgi:predicted PurR-regulated permease PerM
MPAKKPIDRAATFEGISPTLKAWGLRSWFFVGIVLATMAFVVFFTTIASVSVPFVIAVVMAMIFSLRLSTF